MDKTMWPSTLTVLPNRLNCICKQIETHWNYSWNIWLWKGLDKRTSRCKLKQTFSPDQTRKTLFKTKKLRHSRLKKKKKRWPHSKQVAGTSKRVCLLKFGWESSCPDNLCAWSSKSKTGEQKKLQKHDGSLLETKIDTVLNAPGRVQAQIDSLK